MEHLVVETAGFSRSCENHTVPKLGIFGILDRVFRAYHNSHAPLLSDTAGASLQQPAYFFPLLRNPADIGALPLTNRVPASGLPRPGDPKSTGFRSTRKIRIITWSEMHLRHANLKHSRSSSA